MNPRFGYSGKALLTLVGIGALVLISACAPAKTTKGPDKGQTASGAGPDSGGGSSGQSGSGTESGEASLRGGNFSPNSNLETVHFDYDSYSLTDSVRDTLKNNANYLQSHSGTDVLVTGNCDERGTTSYNLALGQKRAQAVRDYYTRLGIGAKTVATISYGKEKPVCSEANEQCWSQNRRAETLTRGSASAHKTESQ
jgi:peptidoglycan-associated lipoprotein